MSRDIKFRAWDTENHRMVIVDILICLSDGTHKVMIGKDDLVYHPIVMQFTGLKDKNGVEIYEGDIIRYKDFSNGGVIAFSGEDKQPRRTAEVKLSNIINGFNPYGMASFDTKSIEVIGNIYSNPELL